MEPEPPSYDSAVASIRASRGPLRDLASRLAGILRSVAARVLPGTGLLAPILARLPKRTPPAPPPPRLSASDCRDLLEVPALPASGRARPRVALAIGSLAAGGAERQLAAFATSARTRSAIEPIVVVTRDPAGAGGHYAPQVRAAGVPIEVAGGATRPEVVALLRRDRQLVERLARLPADVRPNVVMMAGEFLRLRPDVVHAWLDHQNVWSGIAALAVGVPQVVLSTRNVNPTHFPHLCQPWFEGWYRLLLESPRVAILNNSRAGADDYAAWLGCPRGRISVVLNGVDPAWIRPPGQDEVASLRGTLLRGRRQLVVGIFRLSPEKQPIGWLEVVRRIAAARPDVAFAHAGEGPLEAEFVAAGADLVASGALTVLGRRDDVPALLSASDALLHAARFEGTPNVLLEAGQVGCAVVATTAGGSTDVVLDGETGCLRAPDDLAGLGDALLQVLDSDELQQRFARAARQRVASEFSLEAMIDRTLDLYAGSGRAPRPEPKRSERLDEAFDRK